MDEARPSGETERGTGARALAARWAPIVALLAAQLLALSYYEPVGDLLGVAPGSAPEYEVHYGQVQRSVESLDR